MPAPTTEEVVKLQDVCRHYTVGGETVKALDGVSFAIHRGEYWAIMGPSGSGKSTLLNILGCLDTPTSGSYLLDGIEVARRSRTELAHIRNRKLGKNTWLYIDEIYLLFQHEYSANFLFTLWKRMRKYGACGTGLTQNVDDLLQSHTARTMLANSEFLLMLNQASTDRIELARLLNISDNQLSYISGVDFGHGLLKCGSTIVPFVDHFPKNGRLYQLMTTKMSERVEQAS